MSQVINYNGQLINLNGIVIANRFPIRDGLICYFDANISKSYSGAGVTFTDLSVSSHIGEINNGLEFISSGIKCFRFDRVDDHIEIDQIDTEWTTSGSTTYNIWFRGSANGTDHGLLLNYLKGGWVGYQIHSNGLVVYSGNSGSNEYAKSFTPSTKRGWQMVTFIIDRELDEYRLYHNGEYVNNTTVTATHDPMSISTAPLTIGGRDLGATVDNLFGHEVASFMAYNRVLSADEIRLTYDHSQSKLFGPIIQDDLVLHLDANNSKSAGHLSNVMYDLSPASSTVSMYNSPGYDDGDIPAILFDGVNDYGITNIETSSFQDGLTWAGWVRNDAGAAGGWEWMVGGTNQLNGQSGYFFFQIGKKSGSEEIRFETGNFFSNYVLDSTQTVGDGNWHYLVGTVEDNGISLTKNIYLDGVKGASTTVVKSASPGDYGTIQIGHQQRTETTHTEHWEGAIAEVHLYTRGLTEAEVQYNFNARRGRYGI